MNNLAAQTADRKFLPTIYSRDLALPSEVKAEMERLGGIEMNKKPPGEKKWRPGEEQALYEQVCDALGFEREVNETATGKDVPVSQGDAPTAQIDNDGPIIPHTDDELAV